MGYTKIKAVKNHLARCLDYTSNPVKTERFSEEDLGRLLDYTQNQDKTEHQLYVTGFNCDPANACDAMDATRRRWGKDREGHVLAYLGYTGAANSATISDLMESVISDEPAPEVVMHHEEQVDFIPSDIGLSDMEVRLVNVMAHERIMAQALEPFKDKYDYCLIDCMPSLGILTVTSLVAADRVLIPVQAQHFALKGVVSLIKSINQITRRIKPELEIDGIVLTMVDRRTNLSKDVCAALRNSYGYALKIYRTEIPISTRTAESASSAHSVLSYDASGAASVAYKALAKEVVDNERVRQQHHTPLTR